MAKKTKFVQRSKVVALDFSGTDYAGLEVDVNLSLPYGLIQAAGQGGEGEILKLMPLLIADWNICDPATDEFLPVTNEGFTKVHIDVLMVIFAKAMEQLKVGGLSPNADRRSDNN